MVVGRDYSEKSLDEAIGFNKDTIFQYLAFILHNRNADWFGDKAKNSLDKINTLLESIDIPDEQSFELESLLAQTLSETSQYAYESGFREACRLHRTLQSF